jgi:hypothetical protein
MSETRAARGDQVLAVVQYQQQFPAPELRDQRLAGCGRRREPHPEDVGDRVRHQVWCGQRREVHEPDSVAEGADPPCRYGERQPGLPQPPGPVRVSSLLRRSSLSTSSLSRSRPMSPVAWAGRLCRGASGRR